MSNLKTACYAMLFAAGVVFAPLANARPAEPQTETGRQTFIVLCDCSSPQVRRRILQAIEQRGGRLLYDYRTIGGMAVTVANGVDRASFIAKIRRIQNVTDVRESGEQQLH